jgi:hypothetical protein
VRAQASFASDASTRAATVPHKARFVTIDTKTSYFIKSHELAPEDWHSTARVNIFWLRNPDSHIRSDARLRLSRSFESPFRMHLSKYDTNLVDRWHMRLRFISRGGSQYRD